MTTLPSPEIVASPPIVYNCLQSVDKRVRFKITSPADAVLDITDRARIQFRRDDPRDDELVGEVSTDDGHVVIVPSLKEIQVFIPGTMSHAWDFLRPGQLAANQYVLLRSTLLVNDSNGRSRQAVSGLNPRWHWRLSATRRLP